MRGGEIFCSPPASAMTGAGIRPPPLVKGGRRDWDHPLSHDVLRQAGKLQPELFSNALDSRGGFDGFPGQWLPAGVAAILLRFHQAAAHHVMAAARVLANGILILSRHKRFLLRKVWYLVTRLFIDEIPLVADLAEFADLPADLDHLVDGLFAAVAAKLGS